VFFGRSHRGGRRVAAALAAALEQSLDEALVLVADGDALASGVPVVPRDFVHAFSFEVYNAWQKKEIVHNARVASGILFCETFEVDIDTDLEASIATFLDHVGGLL
jgi:hypothetical protein